MEKNNFVFTKKQIGESLRELGLAGEQQKRERLRWEGSLFY